MPVNGPPDSTRECYGPIVGSLPRTRFSLRRGRPRRGLTTCAVGTLVTFLVLLPFASSTGAAERQAGDRGTAQASHGAVQCLNVWGGGTLYFDECSHQSNTGGRGRLSLIRESNIVKWASGKTTTITVTNSYEDIGACMPDGPGYHDLYVMMGTFVNNWGHSTSGSFTAGWCLSPRGAYLGGQSFEL